ncbi:MAG TPA: hypothetical protein V6C95_03600 [Coleofasciculaceae cyanobacterium]
MLLPIKTGGYVRSRVSSLSTHRLLIDFGKAGEAGGNKMIVDMLTQWRSP